MTDKPKFFLIWNPAGRSPTVRHPSMQVAKEEANRLARTNPGQEFWVLEAKGFMQTTDPCAWTKAGSNLEIPF